MSECIGAPAHQFLERYVEGSLPEHEAQHFEEHYFDCAVCLSELQAVQTAQEQLRRHPVAAKTPKRVLNWPLLVSFGALAAALIIGFITLRSFRQTPGRSTGSPAASAPVQPDSSSRHPAEDVAELSSLADLRLPSYHAPTLRGETAGTVFQQGMTFYASGNCAGAIKTLSRVNQQSPETVAAQFYAGVCRMHSGNLTGAADALRRVIAAGDSPQQESAWYYLAQIALARADAAEARGDLERVVSLQGDLENEARKQLAQLPQRPGEK